MGNYLIIPNYKKQATILFAKKLITFLKNKGHNIYLLQDMKEYVKSKTVKYISNKKLEKIDIAIILGGDGTIIQAIRYLQNFNIPIFGINFGHLGYLTECEPPNAIKSLKLILANKYNIEERVMIEGILKRNNRILSKFTCFNEAVIHRSGLSRLLKIKLEINNKEIETFLGDGILMATPTGSTAYNLSCGGPILTPNSNNFVITPICTHSMASSSIVIPDKDNVNLYLEPSLSLKEENTYPMLTIDSCEKYNLHAIDCIHLYKAKNTIKIIKIHNDSFYRILQQKRSFKK